jgi:hypothetical protein
MRLFLIEPAKYLPKKRQDARIEQALKVVTTQADQRPF